MTIRTPAVTTRDMDMAITMVTIITTGTIHTLMPITRTARAA